MKKVTALLLAIVMVLGLGTMASASAHPVYTVVLVKALVLDCNDCV